MKKQISSIFWIICLCHLVPITIWAQQITNYSFSSYNWQLFNPATINYLNTAGEDQSLFLDASYRNQWLGVEGAPTSYNIRFEKVPKIGSFSYRDDAPIKFGLYATQDKADAISQTGVYGNFAYIIQMDRENFLSIGLNAGAFQYKLQADKIDFRDVSDPSAVDQNQWHADFALGAFFVSKERFYIGVSIPQTFNFKLSSRDAEKSFFDTERVPHVYFLGGGFIPLSSNRGTKSFIEPSILLRYVNGISNIGLIGNSPISADVNFKLQWNSLLWGGVGFGTSKNLHFEMGTFLKMGGYSRRRGGNALKIGLAYDYPLGFSGLQLGQTAEIVLGMAFN